VFASALLLAAWGVVLLATFHYPASPLDEGTLVAYPSRLLQGYWPHRDYVTFYGPANVWVLGAAFKLFGASLVVERAVGLAFRMLALGSAIAIGARFGRAPAVAGAAMAAVTWLPWTVQANAGLTAIALALLALALLSRADSPVQRRASLLAALAGATAGLVLLVRFDFLPAIAVAIVPLLVALPGRRRAFFAGLAPMLVIAMAHLVLIGPGAIERVLQDIVASGPGRDLPLPSRHTDDGRLFTLSVIVAVVATSTGLVAMRRRRHPEAALLAAIGLLGGGLLPYMDGRADVFHISSGGAVACITLCCLLGYVFQRITTNRLLGGFAVGIVAFGAASEVTSLGTAKLLLEYRLGANDGVASSDVHVADRSYRLTPTAAHRLQPILDTLDEVAKPGQRLYVGPHDLRFAEYNDSYLYFLLPQLRPAAIYWEDNPGTVNGRRYDLGAHLLRADFLVLNRAYDPTTAGPVPGSSKPNEIVARDFCPLLVSGTYELLARRGPACD
jgi:hypothetical protein